MSHIWLIWFWNELQKIQKKGRSSNFEELWNEEVRCKKDPKVHGSIYLFLSMYTIVLLWWWYMVTRWKDVLRKKACSQRIVEDNDHVFISINEETKNLALWLQFGLPHKERSLIKAFSLNNKDNVIAMQSFKQVTQGVMHLRKEKPFGS